MDPERWLNANGELFDVDSDGEKYQVKGHLTNYEGRRAVRLAPDSPVKAGDILTGQLSKSSVVIVERFPHVVKGRVFQVWGFCESTDGRRTPISSSFNVGTIVNSVVQHSSPGAVQHVQVATTKGNADEIVDKVLHIIERLTLTDEEKADLKADAETVRLQTKKSEPTKGAIASCLSSMKSKLEKAASKAADHAASAAVNGIIQLIGAYLHGG